MEISYTAPNSSTYEPPQIRNNQLIDTILNELLNVQTNYTMGLVNLLQNFIIPLRIQVLSTGIGSDMTRINQVFPPTIDEITRINCILHDSLNKVSRYGYVEIIRVVGMILPYFYKAFIRHEANLKLYTTRLNKFYSKNSKTIFSNNLINKGNYSTREIDSIVSGSLLELPKFKLILKRLHDAIESEKLKKKNFENFVDNETSIITYYYNTAIEVIDAFGGCQGSEDRKIDSQLRVFTPTGKILTELATKWPPELQYGWLSRKVVGIYELRNVKPKSFFDLEILIIFSDHLLFLTIIEESYYIRKKNEPIKSLSVSDILMHSLVNEKPLPVLSLLPSMEVNSWCNLNEVITSCYLGVSSHTSSKQDFLRFLNVSKSGFKS
nr:3-isopropylmalate dehydrogenase [Schwanniomyces occidentalis]